MHDDIHQQIDVFYRLSPNESPWFNSLDIYFAPHLRGANPRKIVVFIHGGSWTSGDKTFPTNLSLPRYFVEQGYVFVSMNYRLINNPRGSPTLIPDQADDIAKALKWLSINCRRYGGDRDAFILLGHSSGAHLAALAVADRKYLTRYDIPTATIRAVIALDSPHLDVTWAIRQIEKGNSGLPQEQKRLLSLYKIFGNTPKRQQMLSPGHHLGPWLDKTRFLFLTAGKNLGNPQTITCRMAEHFIPLLNRHGVSAEHRHLENSDHFELISRFDRDAMGHITGFLSQVS